MTDKALRINGSLGSLVERVLTKYSLPWITPLIPLYINGIRERDNGTYTIYLPHRGKTIKYTQRELWELWEELCFPDPTIQNISLIKLDLAIISGIHYELKLAIDSLSDLFDALYDYEDLDLLLPVPDIIVTVVGSLVTTEAGGTASFTVVLNSEPTDTVTIGLSSSNIAEGTVSPSSLMFDSDNWNVPQTVTVTGVDDGLEDGDISYTIVFQEAVSLDTAYNGMKPSDVALVNQALVVA